MCRIAKTAVHLLPVLLPVVIIIVYYRALSFPFTNWDDIQFILDNPCLRSASRENLRRIFTPGGIDGEMLYIPLTYFTYLVEASLSRLDPMVVHIDNVILHVINSWLVLQLLRRVSADYFWSLLGAAVFAVHPLMVEPVAWAMGRKDLLSTLFALVAVLGYDHFAATGREKYYWLSIVAFCAGLLAKPSLVTLPFAIAVLIGRRPGGGFRPSIARLAIFSLPAVAALAVDTMMPSGSSGPSLPDTGPAFVACSFAHVVTGWFLRLTLLQTPSPFYCWPDAGAGIGVLLPAVLIVVIGVAVMIGLRRTGQDLAVRGILFFLAAAVPGVAILVNPREFMTADRYVYLPMIGLLIAFAAIAQRLPQGRIRAAYGAAAALWLACAGFSAYRQVNVWSSSLTLWLRAVEHCPNVALVRNNLGMAYRAAGQMDAAERELQAGLAIEPANRSIKANLGRLYLDQGRANEAIMVLSAVAANDVGNTTLLMNLADAYAQIDRHEPATKLYQNVLLRTPNHVSARIGLGAVYQKLGRYEDATTEYTAVLQLSPTLADVHFNLGTVYELRQLPDLAEAAYRQAIALNPNLADAYFNLGNLYSGRQRLSEAVEAYAATLRLRPGDAAASINLGNVYYRAGRLTEASALYQRVLDSGAESVVGVLYNLGLIRIQQAEYDAAQAYFERAVADDPLFGPACYELAKLHNRSGNLELAKEYLERAAAAGVPIDAALRKQLGIE